MTSDMGPFLDPGLACRPRATAGAGDMRSGTPVFAGGAEEGACTEPAGLGGLARGCLLDAAGVGELVFEILPPPPSGEGRADEDLFGPRADAGDRNFARPLEAEGIVRTGGP